MFVSKFHNVVTEKKNWEEAEEIRGRTEVEKEMTWEKLIETEQKNEWVRFRGLWSEVSLPC